MRSLAAPPSQPDPSFLYAMTTQEPHRARDLFFREQPTILFGLTYPALDGGLCGRDEGLRPNYLARHIGMPPLGTSERQAYSSNETGDEAPRARMRKAVLRVRLVLDSEKRFQIKSAGSQRRPGDRKPLDQSTDRRPDRHRRGRIVADDDRPRKECSPRRETLSGLKASA